MRMNLTHVNSSSSCSPSRTWQLDTLGGTTVVNLINGTATFTDLHVKYVFGAGYRLQFMLNAGARSTTAYDFASAAVHDTAHTIMLPGTVCGIYIIVYYCFPTALLLLYYCFTAALLLLYCCGRSARACNFASLASHALLTHHHADRLNLLRCWQRPQELFGGNRQQLLRASAPPGIV